MQKQMNNWGLIVRKGQICLMGELSELDESGKPCIVKTSPIVDWSQDTNYVTTNSGTVYVLGEMNPRYDAYVQSFATKDEIVEFACAELFNDIESGCKILKDLTIRAVEHMRAKERLAAAIGLIDPID